MVEGVAGRKRIWLAVTLLLLVLVVAAAIVFVLRPKPTPAPTVGDAVPVGTVAGPDGAGKRTYETEQLGFRLRYPQDWRLAESGFETAEEGEYLTLQFAPPKGTDLRAPALEIVPDPQGFPVEAVADMRWRAIPEGVMATTSTIEVGGDRGIEARMIESTDGRPVHTYEALVIVNRRLFIMHLESSDIAEFEQASAEAAEIVRSIEPY